MMKQTLLIYAILLSLLPSLYAQKSAPPKTRPASHNVKTGTASYYGAKFQGRLMANGQKFDENKLTAASNTLSLGTWVRVSNLRNKKSVIVQITDRMHPKNKRLIDLSKAAAKKLGFLKRGLAKVKVEIVGRGKHLSE
jgi:rare lipoprotein A